MVLGWGVFLCERYPWRRTPRIPGTWEDELDVVGPLLGSRFLS